MQQQQQRFRFNFRPALLDALKAYSGKRFAADLNAGLVVGIVALPLALAFGISSGVSPMDGVWTAIVAGFLASALGGSRLQVTGPTGAFIPLLASLVAVHGKEGLILATLMAGVILMVMGVTGLGKMIKFIPYPVTMGFTCGIAVIIAAGQVMDFLGLPIAKLSPEFVEKLGQYAEHAAQTHGPTAAVGVLALAILVFYPKGWAARVPGSLVALATATLAAWLWRQDGSTVVTTVADRFGALPSSLPAFGLPEITLDRLRELIVPATAIALLGAIESLLSAVVADGMTDDRHNSDQELLAQGVANFVTPFFGGIAATGAIARTATNVRSGASSPVAGIIHALVLLLFVLVAAPVAGLIPLTALAAVLFMVAYRMGEWDMFGRLAKLPRSDAAVFLTTFGLTVIMDLTVAVGLGMVLASMLFIKRVTDVSGVTAYQEERHESPAEGHLQGKLPPGVQVFRLKGAFFFGTADKLETALRRGGQQSTAFILILDQVNLIDGTGLNALETLHERLKSRRVRLILCAPPPAVREVLERSGFLEELGEENVVETLLQGIIRVKTLSA